MSGPASRLSPVSDQADAMPGLAHVSSAIRPNLIAVGSAHDR